MPCVVVIFDNYCFMVSGIQCDSYACYLSPTWYDYHRFWKPADCFRVRRSTLLPIPTPSTAWLSWNGSSSIWWPIQSWGPTPYKVIISKTCSSGGNKHLIFYYLCVSVFCFPTTRKSAISERFGRIWKKCEEIHSVCKVIVNAIKFV